MKQYFTKEEVLELLRQLESASFVEVDELPDVGDPHIIYFVPTGTGGSEMWIWSEDEWKSVGSTEIDLSEYVKITEIVDMVYPVGSTLIRTDGENPSDIYTGTTWEKISEGRMLIGANSSFPLGTTGGEEEVTLTEQEMPAHAHSTGQHYHGATNGNFVTVDGNWYSSARREYTLRKDAQPSAIYLMTQDDSKNTVWEPTRTEYANITMSNTGGGTPHNNMPPYLAVNIWIRTA